MSGEKDVEPVLLPEELLDRVDQRITDTKFESKDEYIRYITKETLMKVEEIEKRVDEKNETVESRLQSLGYLKD